MQSARNNGTRHPAKPKARRSLRAAAAAVMAFGVLIGPASAFWSSHNIDRFDPDANVPRNYDPSAVGRVGVGETGPAATDCYWSREEVFVSGQLRWRPLQVCPYSPLD